MGEVMLLKSILGVVAFVGLFITTFFSYPLPAIFTVFGISMVLEMMNVSLTRGFEGREKMSNISFILLWEKSVLCIVAIISLMSGLGLFGVGVAYIVSNIVSMAVSMHYWSKEGEHIVFSFRQARALGLIKEAVPFAFAALIAVLYMRIDTFFLVYYRPVSEVGWYNAAYRISDAQLFIPSAIVASVFPILSRTYVGNLGEFMRHYQRTFFTLLMIGCTFALVCSLFAEPIILLLYGPMYAHSAESFRLLSWVMPFYYVNVLMGTALIAMGKEKVVTAVITIGAITNIGLNALVVKEYGQVGAASVKIITEIVAFSFQFYFFHRVLPIRGTYLRLS